MKQNIFGVFKKYALWLWCALVFSGSVLSAAQAADFSSKASGNWTSASTWNVTGADADGIPDSDDNVTVAVGNTVTISSSAAAASLMVNGTLSMSNTLSVPGITQVDGTVNITSTTGTKTFTGLVTVNSGAVWNNSGNESVSFNGGLVSSGTFTGGSGTNTVAGALTVNGGTFGANGTMSVSAAAVINGGSVTFTGSTTLSNSLTVAAGAAVTTRNTLSVSGATDLSGTLNIASTTGTKTFIGPVTVNSGGTWSNSANEAVTLRGGLTNTGTFTSGTGTYTFNTNSQALNAADSITFSGSVSISGAIIITNNTTVTIAGSLTGSVAGSTWVNAAGTTLNIGGTPLATGTLTVNASGNTVNYYGGSQTIKAVTYHHLSLGGSGTKTLPATACIVNGTFTKSGTSSATARSAFTFNGDVVISGGTFSGGNYTHSIAGNWTNTGGTFSPGAGTITFNNTTADQFINGTAAAQTFYNITVAKTAQTLSVGGSTTTLTLSNNLTLTSGSFAAGTVAVINVAGNWTNNAGTSGFSAGSSMVNLSIPSGSRTITGSTNFKDLSFNAGGARAFTIAVTTTLTVAGTLYLTDGYLNTGAIVAQGDITLASTFDGSSGTPTTLAISGGNNQILTGGGSATAGDFLPVTIEKTGGTLALAGIIRTGRNWTYTSGTIDPGGSTAVFAARAMTISGSMPFYNLTFNNAVAHTLAAGTTLTSTGTLTLTDGYLNAGAIIAQGNINLASTFDGSSGTPTDLTISGTNDQILTGGGSTTAGDFLPLTINKIGGILSLASTIRTGRNWTYTAGEINPGSSEVVFDLRNLTITGDMTFYNLTFRRAVTYTVASGTTLTVNGALNLTDGYVNTGTVNVTGNINVASTADNGTAVVVLNGTDDQMITCSGTAPGGNMTNTLNIDKTVGRAIINGNVRLHNMNLLTGTLIFQGGATYTFHYTDPFVTSSGTAVNFEGSSGNLVTLRSSTTGRRWTFTVNAAASYSAVYVDARDSNASAGRQIAAISSVNSGNNLNWKFPSALNFTTAVQSIVQNTISSVMTVQLQDGAGTGVDVSSNTRLNLTTTSSTGQFSSSSLFGDVITYVTIPQGSSSASFYYRDSTAGAYTITAAEFPSQGWTDAAQSLYVENKGTYNYKKEIILATNVTLVDFQVSLTVDTRSLVTAGKMNSDGSDIRFYDSDDITSLPYWIESGMNTTTTKIWVRVPSIAAPSSKIYMYYGLSSAGAVTSGSMTFDFFDDFDTLSDAIWAKTNTSTTTPTQASGSRLTVPRGSVYSLSTVSSSSSDKMVEAKARWTNAIGSYSGLMSSNSQSTSGSNSNSKALVYYMRNSPNNNYIVQYYGANGTTTGYNLGSGTLFTAVTNTDYIMGFVTTSANTVCYYRDYTLLRTLTGTWNYPFYVWLGYFTGSSAGTTDIKDLSVDWVRVRKYAAVDPSVSIGAETKNIAQLGFSTPAQTNIIQGRSSDIMTVQTQDKDGGAVNVSVDTTINLSSSSAEGGFSTSAGGPWTETLDVTILAGEDSVDFYYMDTEVGTPTVTAAESPDVGWTNAEQQERVNPAVNTFEVSASSPQVAGQPFTLTIKAIDEDGAVSPTYSDAVTITVNYITPAAGAGTLAVTSISSFANGIANVTNESFSDCGTITITVTKTDDAAKTGTSNTIVFIPYDFTVVPEESALTVNKPFSLTVTARNVQGNTTPNYKGSANVSAVYVSPSGDQGGSVNPALLGNADFSNGIAAVAAAKYDKWGKIKIKVSDALDAARTGESAEIVSLPKDFSVVPALPPSARAFYYLKENIALTVAARDHDNNTVTNYQGAINLISSDNSVNTAYTFVPGDMGAHVFTFSFTEAGRAQMSCKDAEYAQIAGVSEVFEVKEGKIVVLSASGNVGKLEVKAEIRDAQDRVITEDNSTSFTVSLLESAPDDSALCETKTVPVTVSEGRAGFVIEDSAPERVTVTPQSDPELTPVPGEVVFGSFSGRGMGIDTWREIK